VLAPVPVPAVVTEREELAERVAQVVLPETVEAEPEPAELVMAAKPMRAKPASVRAAPPKAMAVDNARKAAFTLRLDASRHLKLRLAAAVTGRSAQQVVTEALDAFLEGLPEIDRLAQQLPH
jgi:hypothetical protein